MPIYLACSACHPITTPIRGRRIVLVDNIRDENYYDPNYPMYIAGFFSPSLSFTWIAT